MEIHSLYDFYHKRTMDALKHLHVYKQIEMTSSVDVAILDYCGISHKYTHLYGENITLHLMDNTREVFNLFDQYDIIFVYRFESQQLTIPFECVLVDFTPNLFDYFKTNQ